MRRSTLLAWFGVLAIAMHVLLPAYFAPVHAPSPVLQAGTSADVGHHHHHGPSDEPAAPLHPAHNGPHDCALCQVLKHAALAPAVPALRLGDLDSGQTFTVSLSHATARVHSIQARPRAPPLLS